MNYYPDNICELNVTPYYADDEICFQDVQFSVPGEKWSEFEMLPAYRELTAYLADTRTQCIQIESYEIKD